MRFIDNVRSLKSGDIGETKLTRLLEMIEPIDALLARSRDPLRRAIVCVLDYQDGDPEEYAVLIGRMCALLPQEERHDVAAR